MAWWTNRKANIFSFFRPGSRLVSALPFVAGVVLTGLAVLMATRRIGDFERRVREENSPVEIVVASRDIAQGETFSVENLAKRSLPSSGTGRRNVPAGEFELLLGARAKISVSGGEPVLWTDVEEPLETERLSLSIPAGRLAHTLGVDGVSSFSGMVRPGDRVDLLCEAEDLPSGGAWIRNLPVLAVDRFRTPAGPEPEPSEVGTVTVLVSPGEGRILSSASRAGAIHWFLRHPEENPSVPPGRILRNPAVEILLAGLPAREYLDRNRFDE